MKALLVTVTVLVAAAAVGLGLSVALHHRSGPGGAGGGPLGGATTVAGPTTTLAPEIVPAPGQAFVTGTATSFHADNANGPALRPPFTITIAARGQGNADITGVAAAGQDVEIFWYGGQPLPVSGTGELAVDGGSVTVDTSGITWGLDGAPGRSRPAISTWALRWPWVRAAWPRPIRASPSTRAAAALWRRPATPRSTWRPRPSI